ncbi:Phosphatidate cytidylyltransferase [Globisporangium polare]
MSQGDQARSLERTGAWPDSGNFAVLESQLSPAFSTSGDFSPSESSFPYMQEVSSSFSGLANGDDDDNENHQQQQQQRRDSFSSASAAALSTGGAVKRKLGVFFRLNAVQRTISAAILAPLVTVFIWQSPAFATATVCSFMTSACLYEYSCIANRIQLHLLIKLQAIENDSPLPGRRLACHESATSHITTRNNESRTAAPEAEPRRSSFKLQDNRPSTMRGRTSFPQSSRSLSTDTRDPAAAATTAATSDATDKDLRGFEAQLQLPHCAVTGLAGRFFGGREWLAACVVSLSLSAVMSVAFLSLGSLIPQLRDTDFYESRYFYAIATDFVAVLCACYTPNWRYAAVISIENVVFTILTMHSTICPINQFSCGLSVEPGQVLLAGMLVVLFFRFTTSRTGVDAFLNFTLDMLGYVYIIGSLSVLVAFVDDKKKTMYRKLLIALLFVVWASDTGAYITGKVLACLKYRNYNPLAAHLSKNKDYEGTLGAILFGVAAMMTASDLLDVPGSTGTKVVFAVLAVVIGRLGDLFESLLKRAAGVKDSGKLIPGHGGVLDRIDALMFAALVFARYYAVAVGVKHDKTQ